MSPETTDVANVAKAALAAVKADAIAAGRSGVYIGEPTDADRSDNGGELPRHYQVLHVTTGAGGGYRLAGGRSADKYRLVVRSVGSTYGEAAWETDRAKEALDDAELDLPGFDWQQNEDESNVPIAPDNALAPSEYEGVRVWTTVIGPLSG